MTFDTAQRLTEILLALAFVQQGLEHLAGPRRDRPWAVAQVTLALGVAWGVAPVLSEGLLLLVSIATIRHFRGPYNGGSDRMRLLVLSCLWLSRVAPTVFWQRAALGYLAAQLVLSYTIAGWVKLANPDWRSGRALGDVFAFSVYPVSEALRAWADAPRVLRAVAWLAIAFEVLFPLALLHGSTLAAALVVALAFHLINAAVFGLNRFVWIWLAGYPSLWWFQQATLAHLFER